MILDTGDWHIDNGRLTPAGYGDKLNAFLDLAEPHPLLLGGDTLELYACEWWEILNGPYLPVLKRIQERKRETVVIPGNHDAEDQVLKRFFPKADVRKMVFFKDREVCHGYEFDPLLDDWYERLLAHEFDRAFFILNIPFLNALREKIADKDRNNDFLLKNIDRVRDGLRYLVHHSHCELNQDWFANPGSPLKDRFPYIEIDERSGDCTLKYLE